MTPRHLYWVTCSISLLLNLKFITVAPLLPTAIHLVLISLTLIKLREQNFRSPSNCLCIPFSESEINIKSSAQSIWATIFSPTHIPYSESRNVPKSDIYLRKRKPLATPPWLTPSTLSTKWLNQPWCLTRNLVLVYKLRRVSITFPFQPHFLILWNKTERLTISNAYMVTKLQPQ